MKNEEHCIKHRIVILIILNHDNMHLWLYFKEEMHKMHDINAWNCMLSPSFQTMES